MFDKIINLIMYLLPSYQKKFCIMCEIFLFVLFFRIMYSLVIKKVLHYMRDIFMLLFLSDYMYIFISYQKKFCKLCVSYSYLFFFFSMQKV